MGIQKVKGSKGEDSRMGELSGLSYLCDGWRGDRRGDQEKVRGWWRTQSRGKSWRGAGGHLRNPIHRRKGPDWSATSDELNELPLITQISGMKISECSDPLKYYCSVQCCLRSALWEAGREERHRPQQGRRGKILRT